METSNEKTSTQELKVVRQKKKNNRYLINIIVILIITFGYSFFSLWNDLPAVLNVLSSADADYRIGVVVILLIFGIFFIEGLILFVFARLYTPNYKLHRGIANGLVGTFYSDITPSSTGGQFAQVKTFTKQGVPVSTSASILVMHFIIFQSVLLLFGAISIGVNVKYFSTMAPVQLFELSIPIWIFSILGFVISTITILGLFLLSYSQKIHNVVINKGVDLFAKMRIIKEPEKKKNALYVATENFRVELRRLNANIPATILITTLFIVKFIMNYSITYFIALMLQPELAGSLNYLTMVTKSSFLNMITSLVPIPGAAGFSEYFFELMFKNDFGVAGLTKAVQILWRFATFYTGLIIGGLVTAFYRSSMEEFVDESGHVQTFAEVQSATFGERKKTSDTLYATSQLSIKEIQRKLTSFGKKKKKHKFDEDE